MNGQQNPTPQPIKDFLKGLFLVQALHVLFLIFWNLVANAIASATNYFQGINGLVLFIPIFLISVSQIAYVLPLYELFAKRNRQQVCKGIAASAIFTIFINGSCFLAIGGDILGSGGVLFLLMPIATIIGLLISYLVNRRF
jgi:hypothetical protein